MWKGTILILVIVVLAQATENKLRSKRDMAYNNRPEYIHPCVNEYGHPGAVRVEYRAGLPPGEENQYDLVLTGFFANSYEVVLKFDSDATVTLLEPITARITNTAGNIFMKPFKTSETLRMHVKGPPSGAIPYIKYVEASGKQLCVNASTGYLNEFILGYQKKASSITQVSPNKNCGRRKVGYTGLIVNGQLSKHGDWPWHAALYILERSSLTYICGGTLISKTMVLTAAHCVTINGSPLLAELLSVVLGKYNLMGGDPTIQEKQVYEIIVNEEYVNIYLKNDIALLKLKTEVVYNDYVQPACLWDNYAYSQLPTGSIFGSVVGWGLNQTDNLSPQIQQIKIPKQPESVCLKSNPDFYSQVLTSKNFCAGFQNGTSACNGDSGGGFLVFVPDSPRDTSPHASGAWYVHGIVSLTVSRKDAAICDPHHYVVFTDVEKYLDWLKIYIK